MRHWKEMYGQDADGNRGILVDMYEVDKNDFDEIVEQLLSMYPDSDDRPYSCTVTIDGIDVEVDVGDYL